MTLTEEWSKAHPSTLQLLRWLETNPNIPEPQRNVAQECEALADFMMQHCNEGQELSAGLRKLLEAKDCFVRASFAPVE